MFWSWAFWSFWSVLSASCHGNMGSFLDTLSPLEFWLGERVTSLQFGSELWKGCSQGKQRTAFYRPMGLRGFLAFWNFLHILSRQSSLSFSPAQLPIVHSCVTSWSFLCILHSFTRQTLISSSCKPERVVLQSLSNNTCRLKQLS